MFSFHTKTWLLLSISLLFAIPTQAGMITFGFTGEIGYTVGNGAGLYSGDFFSGAFTYDNEAPLSRIIEPNTRALYGTGGIRTLIGGSTFEATDRPQLQILNNYGGYRDDFFLSIRNYDDIGTGFLLLQIDMPDMTGMILDSLAIPTVIDVETLAAHGRLFVRDFSSPGDEEGYAVGYFDSVQPVPEPSSILLLMVGLALLLGWDRRSRRDRQHSEE